MSELISSENGHRLHFIGSNINHIKKKIYASSTFLPFHILHLSYKILFNRLLPESPRWLIQKGKKEEAIKELQKAAKWNGKKPFDPIWLSSVVSEIHESVSLYLNSQRLGSLFFFPLGDNFTA